MEFSKNTKQSSKELSAIILSYLNPKIDEPIRKMVQSISLTIEEVSRLIEKNEIVYIGVSKNGIKFVKEKSSTEEKPVEKQEEKPEEKPVQKPYEYEPGELEENKLFESINRKNKNIFKLR